MKEYIIKIKEEDIEYEYEIHEESPCEIKGNVLASGNKQEDEKAEQWVIDQLESGNQWAWCTMRVVARWRDRVEAETYLGMCSFKNEEDFVKSEYKQMKIEAKDELLQILGVEYE